MTEQEKFISIPEDMPSVLGWFSWHKLNEYTLPCLYRSSGKKYVCTRMTETTIREKYIRHLDREILFYVKLPTRSITAAEKMLLDEINSTHCDFSFGRHPISPQTDFLVEYDDIVKYIQFLDICYLKLTSPAPTCPEECGFLRINGQAAVPYVVKKDDEKKYYVPLFYLTGVTRSLKATAITLDRWESAYLRFCCKVQGIQKQFFASEQYLAISLEDLKTLYPEGTTFDMYWPVKEIERRCTKTLQHQGPDNPLSITTHGHSSHDGTTLSDSKINTLQSLSGVKLNASAAETTTLSTPSPVPQHAHSPNTTDRNNLNDSAPSSSRRIAEGRLRQRSNLKRTSEVFSKMLREHDIMSLMDPSTIASTFPKTQAILPHQYCMIMANHVALCKTRLPRTAKIEISSCRVIKIIPECSKYCGTFGLSPFEIKTVSLGHVNKDVRAINLNPNVYSYSNMATTLYTLRNTYFCKLTTKELRILIVNFLKRSLYAPNLVQFNLLVQEAEKLYTIGEIDDLLLVRIVEFQDYYRDLRQIYYCTLKMIGMLAKTYEKEVAHEGKKTPHAMEGNSNTIKN